MSDFGMATLGDVKGANAHADRIVKNLKKEHDSRITQLEAKVENLQKDNAKLWEIVRELRKLLPVANASTSEPHDTWPECSPLDWSLKGHEKE